MGVELQPWSGILGGTAPPYTMGEKVFPLYPPVLFLYLHLLQPYQLFLFLADIQMIVHNDDDDVRLFLLNHTPHMPNYPLSLRKAMSLDV